jgi:hypothetical protein
MVCQVEHQITADMRRVHREFAASELIDVDLVVAKKLSRRTGACLMDVVLVLVDGHGDGWKLVCDIDMRNLRDDQGRGIRAPILVLGGCWAATSEFIENLRRSLDQPTAFLGCIDEAEYRHGPELWPYILRGLGELAGRTLTPEELHQALQSWLDQAIAEQPKTTLKELWRTELLDPLP